MNSKTISKIAVSTLLLGSVALLGQGCNWSWNNVTSTNDGSSSTSTSDTSQTDQKNPNTKAADFRVSMNALNRQHVYLSAAALRSAYDARPDMNAAKSALDENSQAIASGVSKIYGSSAGNELLTLWRSHVDSYLSYATATKANDRTAKNAAMQKLSTQANDLASFFARSNSNLQQGTVRQMLTDHANLITSLLDSYASRDYTGSFSKEMDADEQAGKIADVLTTAIVKQNPSKF